MFNGIIKNTGVVKEIKKSNSMEITINSKLKTNNNMIGSSISCDGVSYFNKKKRKTI